MSISETDAIQVISALREAGVGCWVAGGWGVDALVGHQTRDHDDLDLAISVDQEAAVIDVLGSLGYRLAVDERPARFALTAPGGRSVDVHPVAFSPTGDGVQRGFDGIQYAYPAESFAAGSIGGVSVPCLSADRLLAFHLGYEPSDNDRRDMAALSAATGIALPEPYAPSTTE